MPSEPSTEKGGCATNQQALHFACFCTKVSDFIETLLQSVRSLEQETSWLVGWLIAQLQTTCQRLFSRSGSAHQPDLLPKNPEVDSVRVNSMKLPVMQEPGPPSAPQGPHITRSTKPAPIR